MIDFWKAALKVSGPVAIIGFLIWVVITNFFKEEILTNFDSEQRFTIILIIVCGLLLCLLTAIFAYMKKGNRNINQAPGNKAVFNKSTIKGDVVLGNKHEKKKK